MWIGAGHCRAARRIGNVRRCCLGGRRDLFGLVRSRQPARRIALWQDLDRQIRAVALAQTAADAVRGLDDGVVSQDEAVLGADLDAYVAALTPLVYPTDVDEVDDGGCAMRSSFGGVGSSRSCISRGSCGTLGRAPVR
jgi:hypothetical protein